MNNNYNFIKINNKKEPLHSLDETFTYKQVQNEENLAVLVVEPYIVLDVDDKESFEILYEIIKNEDIKCRVMKSNRGGHFWFKSINTYPNWVGANTPITLKVDVKCHGKKSLVTVKKDGEWRKWLREDENVDELPFWLRPNKLKKDLLGLKAGDGRDPQLFSYIIPLINLKYSKEQILKTFNIVNKYIFEESLKQEEVDKMFDGNDVFDKKDLQFFDKRTFLHNIFVDWMRESYFFKSYGNQVYLYHKGLYIDDRNEIARHMIEQIPNLTMRQQNEAYENLRLKTTCYNENIDPLIVNVQNGIYDLTTSEHLEHSPYKFSINQFNCKYDPTAYDVHVDNFLNGITENNKNLKNLLIEMLGYILIQDCRFQKAFILLGQGANGKSVFLEMIMNWAGHKNCSSLALEDLSKEFVVAELVNKVVNIGDDSGGDLLKNTAIFKKIVTGDSITVQRKFGQPFPFSNKAKMIFSANNLPPSTDKSDGFFRRIVVVPFNAVFNEKTPGYDPNIIDKLTTPNASSYLLNLAIAGAKSLLKNNHITLINEVIEATKSYETDNNNVIQWVESSTCEIIDRDMQQVYTDYCLYCNSVNSIPMQIRKFNLELRKKYPLYELKHVVDTHSNKYVWTKKDV